MKFWKETAERAVKTIAQTLLAVLTVAGPLDVVSVDWQATLSIAAGAGLLSVLTSLASRPVGEQDSPSLVEK